MRQSLFCTLLLLTSILSFRAQAFESVDCFTGPLTAINSSLTEDNLNSLLNIAKLNQDMKLIELVKKKLGIKEDKELLNFIRYCSDSELGDSGRIRGLFLNKLHYNVTPKFYSTPDWSASTNQLIKNAYHVIEKEDDTHFKVFMISNPQICLRKGMSTVDSYSVLIHELTHFYFTNFEKRNSLERSNDKDKFIQEELMRDGGEFAAFTLQAKTVTRLNKLFPGIIQKTAIHSYFDDDGNLIDKEGLQNHILYTLDYDDNFQKAYNENQKLKKDIIKRKKNGLEIITTNIDIASSNVNVFKNNLKITKDNLRIVKNNKSLSLKNIQHYKQRHDSKNLQKWRNKLSKSESEIIHWSDQIQENTRLLEEWDAKFQNWSELKRKLSDGLQPKKSPQISQITPPTQDTKDNGNEIHMATPHPKFAGVFVCANDNSKIGDQSLSCH